MGQKCYHSDIEVNPKQKSNLLVCYFQTDSHLCFLFSYHEANGLETSENDPVRDLGRRSSRIHRINGVDRGSPGNDPPEIRWIHQRGSLLRWS